MNNTEQMVSARVCAYTPGQSKVELQLIPLDPLPSWLELGQPVTVQPIAQHQGEVERLRQLQAAFNEWVDKSQWARKGAMADELGMHLADVIKQRFDILCAELAERDSLLRHFIEESEQDFVSLATVDRAKAALSASAETEVKS